MESENIESNNEKNSRGFWLTAFLILMFILNPLTAFAYFMSPQVIIDFCPKANLALVYFLGFLCLLNVALAFLIWRWKKIGVYGFYALISVAFILNLYIGLGIMGSLMGLVGGVIVLLATKKRWERFS